MSAVIFICPGCNNCLSIETEYAGSQIDCPHCETQSIVPHSSIYFLCKSCGRSLAIPADLPETQLWCPYCEKEVVKYFMKTQGSPASMVGKIFQIIKKILRAHIGGHIMIIASIRNFIKKRQAQRQTNIAFASPTQTPAPSPMPAPVPVAHVAQPISTETEPKKSRLSVGKSNIETMMPINNAILDRWGAPPQPVSKAKQMSENLFKLIKFLLTLLLFAGILVSALYFVTLDTKKENSAWITSGEYIAKLSTTPSLFSKDSLHQFLKDIPDKENKSNEAKSGLMSVFALGLMFNGDMTTGGNACKYISANYPNSSFCKYVSIDSMYDVCSECKNKGNLQIKCAYCNGGRKCVQCKGDGKIQVVKKATSMGGFSSNNKSQKMGNSSNSQPSQPLYRTCSTCLGSGQCPKCEGNGYITQGCEKCGGKGKILSQTKINSQFKSAITAYLPFATKQAKKAKVYNLLLTMQSWVKSGVEMSQEQLDSANLPFLNSGSDGNDNETNEEKPDTDTTPQNNINNSNARYIIDKDRLSLFDAIMLLCNQYKFDVAIDPESMFLLASSSINRSEMNVITSMSAFQEFIEKHALVLKTSFVSSSEKRLLITDPSIWQYSYAFWLIRKGQISQAIQALRQQNASSSPYTQYCIKLLDNLNTIQSYNQEMADIRKQTNDALQNYKSAYSKLRVNSSASNMTLKKSNNSISSNNEVAEQAAKSAYNQCVNEIYNLRILLVNSVQKTQADNQLLWQSCWEAYQSQLFGEASFILENILNNYASLRDIVKSVQAISLSDSSSELNPSEIQRTDNTFNSLTEIPYEIQELKKTLNNIIQSSESYVVKAKLSLVSDPMLSFGLYSTAFSMDRTSLFGRTGMGYCAVKNYLTQLGRIFGDQVKIDDAYINQLARELQTKQKYQTLHALSVVSNGKISIPNIPSNNEVGTAAGLAVNNLAGGELFPLTVRIVNNPNANQPQSQKANRRTAPFLSQPSYGNPQQNSDDPFAAISEAMSTSGDASSIFPISFGDYGQKDPFILISALEAYKWASWKYPDLMRNKNIHIEFRNLTADKYGDSAGMTIAMGAYSSLHNAPIRQDIAMSGSIRSDGSIQAVGGILEKVSGAVQSEKVELLILPKANQPELSLLPVDTLCRIVIVCVDNINLCINYATKTDGKDYNSEAINMLRQAQMMLLMGGYNEAKPILMNIASQYPEIYNARKLIDIYSAYMPEDAQ